MRDTRRSVTHRDMPSEGKGVPSTSSLDRKVKLRKREIALAVGVGALAVVGYIGILSDGFGGPGSYFADDRIDEAAAPERR